MDSGLRVAHPTVLSFLGRVQYVANGSNLRLIEDSEERRRGVRILRQKKSGTIIIDECSEPVDNGK